MLVVGAELGYRYVKRSFHLLQMCLGYRFVARRQQKSEVNPDLVGACSQSPSFPQMKHTSSTQPSRISLAPAFTLVELIVVIGIITVLMTIGSFGIKNFTKASGVGVGVPIAENLFAQARALAIEKGGDARLLICADATETQKHLRFMLLVYKDAAGKWVANSRGSYLPEGVFFSRTYSHTNHVGDTGVIPAVSVADEDIFGSEEAVAKNDNLSGPHFYYEFNSQGVVGFRTPTSDTSDFVAASGASFVIGAGLKPPGVANPTVSSAGGTKNFGGFVIWKQGRTSTFKHPDQINIPANPTTF